MCSPIDTIQSYNTAGWCDIDGDQNTLQSYGSFEIIGAASLKCSAPEPPEYLELTLFPTSMCDRNSIIGREYIQIDRCIESGASATHGVPNLDHLKRYFKVLRTSSHLDAAFYTDSSCNSRDTSFSSNYLADNGYPGNENMCSIVTPFIGNTIGGMARVVNQTLSSSIVIPGAIKAS